MANCLGTKRRGVKRSRCGVKLWACDGPRGGSRERMRGGAHRWTCWGRAVSRKHAEREGDAV